MRKISNCIILILQILITYYNLEKKNINEKISLMMNMNNAEIRARDIYQIIYKLSVNICRYRCTKSVIV